MSVFLPRKQLFLLALASAKRVGEIHAHLHRISHSRGGAEVSFTFVAGFVAKTQDPPPLLLGLRALLYRPYQTRAQIAMGDCYVPCGHQGVTGTVLLHIVLDVSGCSSLQDVARRRSRRTRSPSGSGRRYLLCSSSRGDPFGILLRGPGRPRGIAPSLLFKKNFAVAQVSKAGTWRRHTTFTRHYRRDLAYRSLETFHLGPVVAAQALV